MDDLDETNSRQHQPQRKHTRTSDACKSFYRTFPEIAHGSAGGRVGNVLMCRLSKMGRFLTECCLGDFLATARRRGLLVLDSDILHPEESLWIANKSRGGEYLYSTVK